MATEYGVSVVAMLKDQLTKPLGRLATSLRTHLGGPLQSIRGPLGEVTSGLRTLATSAAAVSGVALVGAAAAVKSYADQADALSDLSAQVGVSVEALQEWQYAAEIAGIESGAFEGSLRKLRLGLGQMQTGEGKLLKWLEETPAAFREQAKAITEPEQALGFYLKALGKITNDSKRAAAAVEIFGKSGADMAVLAGLGTEQIEKLRAQKRGYGVITAEAADAAGAFNDSILGLKLSLGGLTAEIGGALIPVLTPLIEKATEWIAANRELVAGKVVEFVRGFIDVVGSIPWGTITAGLQELIAKLASMVDSVGGVNGVLAIFAVIVGSDLIGKLTPLVGLFGKLITILGGAAKAIRVLGVAMLTTPIGLVLTGIGLAVAAIAADWDNFVAAMSASWEKTKAIFVTIGEAIGTTWHGIIEGLSRAIDAFGKMFSAAWDGIGKAMSWVYDHTIEPILSAIEAGLEGIKDLARWAGLLDDVTPDPRLAEWAASQSAAGTRSALASQASAVGGGLLRGAAAVQSMFVGGRIAVEVSGPPGTRVREATSENPAVPLTTTLQVGRRTVGAGGGL